MTEEKGKVKEEKKPEKPIEGEVVENKELAPKPEARPVIFRDLDATEEMIKQAEKEIEINIKMIKLSLKMTNWRDWLDQNKQPYLEISGTSKINRVWGVSILNQDREILDQKDDKGIYKVVIMSAIFEWNKIQISEIGTCTTRDQLFAIKDKKLIPQEDVSLENVIKAATTNLHNRGLKKMLGLKFTWEDLKEAGIDVDKIRKEKSFKYDKKPASTEDKKKQFEIRDMIKEMHPKDEDAKNWLKMFTSFPSKDKDKDGKPTMVPGVDDVSKLVGTRLNINLDKIKKHFEKWKKNLGENNKTQEEACPECHAPKGKAHTTHCSKEGKN